MLDLTPREFEHLVADLFAARGFEVELTPFSKDGGKDILIAHQSDIGDMLVYVECKRWNPNRLIGPEIVRSLHGVVSADQATAGVIATTSSFTRGARDAQHSIRHQMQLRDFADLCIWLRETRGQ